MKKKIIAVLGMILWSLYPVAFLLFQNLGEAQLYEVVEPAKFFLITSIGVFVVATLALKSIVKGSLVAAFAAIVLENFAFLEGLLYTNWPQIRYWHIVACCLFAFLGIGLILKKCSAEFSETISKAGCIVAAVMICINLIPNLSYFFTQRQNDNSKSVNVETVISDADDLPNIYWLTFDECSSFTVMEKYYDYHNDAFIEGMQDLGFNLSFNSRNSSHKSATVFANYFSLNYAADDSFSQDQLFSLRKNSFLLELLHANQYQIYGYGRLNEMIGDDNQYVEYISTLQKKSSQTIGGESMADLLLSQSVFYPFFEKSRDHFSGAVLNTFDILQDLPEEDVPTVFISYLMTPHEPFIFTENGSLNESENYYNWQDRQYYRDQYIFITNQILETVQRIVEKDPEAIIIVQSDHSARAASDTSLYRKWISVEDMRSILNCVYYQGKVFDIEGLSGVETLRKVIQTILNVELPELLEVPYNV